MASWCAAVQWDRELVFNKPVLIPKFMYYCMIVQGTDH